MKTFVLTSKAFKIRIFYMFFMVGMALIMNLFSACHPEEEITPIAKETVTETDTIRIADQDLDKAARKSTPDHLLDASCLDLRKRGEKLIAEYKNASDTRREEIIAELRRNGAAWRSGGCQDAYGDIGMVVPTFPNHTITSNPIIAHPITADSITAAPITTSPTNIDFIAW